MTQEVCPEHGPNGCPDFFTSSATCSCGESHSETVRGSGPHPEEAARFANFIRRHQHHTLTFDFGEPMEGHR